LGETAEATEDAVALSGALEALMEARAWKKKSRWMP